MAQFRLRRWMICRSGCRLGVWIIWVANPSACCSGCSRFPWCSVNPSDLYKAMPSPVAFRLITRASVSSHAEVRVLDDKSGEVVFLGGHRPGVDRLVGVHVLDVALGHLPQCIQPAGPPAS